MTDFVLDNSVSMRWLLGSEKAGDQKYAEKILCSLIDCDASIPNLWHLEACNVLLKANKNGAITDGELETFINQLENLPLVVDTATTGQAFNRTLGLAKAYNISSYDAAYLELAIRLGLPLATLDKDLLKAASKAKVAIYLKT